MPTVRHAIRLVEYHSPSRWPALMGSWAPNVFTLLTTTVIFALLAVITLVPDAARWDGRSAGAWPAVPLAWWVKLVMPRLTGATYDGPPAPSAASPTAPGGVALHPATPGPAWPIAPAGGAT